MRASAPTEKRGHEYSAIDGLKKYLDARADEDKRFWADMQEAADDLILKSFAAGALPTRKDNIDMLRLDCRSKGVCGYAADWQGSNKGISIGDIEKPQIERTWTEVYDALAAIAINRYRQALVDERNKRNVKLKADVPTVGTLPTVKWTSRAETPPIGEPLLLYEMTNAGPVYTPAMYEGGSTFSKPHQPGLLGRELTGMAHRFSMWLKFPDPSKFGEEYRVGVSAPVPHRGKKPRPGTGSRRMQATMPAGPNGSIRRGAQLLNLTRTTKSSTGPARSGQLTARRKKTPDIRSSAGWSCRRKFGRRQRHE